MSQGRSTRIFDELTIDGQIEVMDIGASVINETPVYKRMLELGLGHLNAFEGDARQVQKIVDTYGEGTDVFSDFLFDGSAQRVHLATPESGMSSLFKPDGKALKFFNGFEIFGKIDRIEPVQTRRLDDVEGLPLIDLVKMDIQGAELTVLQNGTAKLANCLAIQLEVSFICLYEGQPGFGEIDVWMRAQGYVPHRFMEVKRWSIAPTVFNNNFRIPGNQLLEGDIVYIRDPLHLERLSNDQLKKFAAIAHYCFGSYDLCVFILLELEKRQVVPVNWHTNYTRRIGEFT